MLFFIYTTFIVPATVLIPIAYAFINYRGLTRAFKIILAFIIFSAVMNTIASVMARGYHMRTTGIYHIYTPFEFASLRPFFRSFITSVSGIYCMGLLLCSPFFACLIRFL
jgi:hypothetical protein